MRHISRAMLCFSGLLSVALLLAPPVAAQSPCSHYASPTGGGNGLSEGSPFHIADFWGVAQPGATLCLLDGTYTGGQNMLAPPNGFGGTSSGRITVRALHDGGVYIDGQYANHPLYLVNNSWLQIEGVNAANSAHEAIALYSSNNNILRRVCGWNANPPPPVGSGNNLHTMIVASSSDNLLEDMCLFGYGRNTYNDYAGPTHRNTMRRMWMRWDGWAPGNGGTNPGPALQSAYGTDQDSLYENLILVWGATKYTWSGSSGANHAGMIFRDGPPPGSPGYRTNGLIIYGYDNAPLPVADGFFLSRWVPHTFQDVFVDGRSQPQAYTAGINCDVQVGDGYDGGHCDQSRVDRVTALRAPSQSAVSLPSAPGHTNINDCTSLSDCPNFYTGSGDRGQGARACGRYQDGTLTSTPLWPWPMDDRIKAALAWDGAPPLAGSAGPGYAAQTVTSEIVSRYGPLPSDCGTGGSSVPGPTNLRVRTVQ